MEKLEISNKSLHKIGQVVGAYPPTMNLTLLSFPNPLQQKRFYNRETNIAACFVQYIECLSNPPSLLL